MKGGDIGREVETLEETTERLRKRTNFGGTPRLSITFGTQARIQAGVENKAFVAGV